MFHRPRDVVILTGKNCTHRLLNQFEAVQIGPTYKDRGLDIIKVERGIPQWLGVQHVAVCEYFSAIYDQRNSPDQLFIDVQTLSPGSFTKHSTQTGLRFLQQSRHAKAIAVTLLTSHEASVIERALRFYCGKMEKQFLFIYYFEKKVMKLLAASPFVAS